MTASTRSDGCAAPRIRAAALVVGLFATPVFGQTPVIDSLSMTSADRSARLLVFGSGFGDDPDGGQVLIDGLAAITTQWFENEIHAYVPEAASLGTVEVQVVTEDGASDPAPLEVTQREAQGRVLWRFQADAYVPTRFVAVGPDGTIYTTDRQALYAIAPDGALLWVSKDARTGDGNARAIDVGPDGTIYTGMGLVGDVYAIVVALNPDGSTKWQFIPPVPAPLLTGPNVGPDGNIYAAQDAFDGGLGAFSLDPDGNLRWSNPGVPDLGPGETTLTVSNIEFGTDRLHTGIVNLRSGGNPAIYTFDLKGAQLWTTWDLDVHNTSFPTVDPLGRVLCTWGQTGARALSPEGEEVWFTLHPDGASLVRRPAADSQGLIYTGDFVGVDLWALTPDGETRWVLPSEDNASLHDVAVSPDHATLLVSGGQDGLGFVRGHDPAGGEPLWRVDFAPENGMAQHVNHFQPAFSADSGVAYVTTHFAGSINDYGYVYAIAIEGEPLRLSHGALRRGQPATFVVRGARESERIDFLYSRAGVGAGPCPGTLGGLCLDLLRPVVHFGRATADEDGRATLQTRVPANASVGMEIHTQAVARRGARGENSVKSNAVSATVEP